MFYVLKKPSSASKIVKIAHQQTLRRYCQTVTVMFFKCYCLTYPYIFNCIWSYRTSIQARLGLLEI